MFFWISNFTVIFPDYHHNFKKYFILKRQRLLRYISQVVFDLLQHEVGFGRLDPA